ncbi:kinase-like domain-containing protein [Chaetomium tenue]|uniref:Kinase-like domain-containing protein n=1 Tax=Chaetomium tenue TaxID=1854479 RepID=A0ACB7NXG5_9PEZI|nr:kinase-like domain-containing protein [Chaetomium globosum]
MDENLDDLVAAANLETEFSLGYVKHRFHDGALTPPTREEIWDIRAEIGRGASGVVRKEERRLDIPQEPQLRAVKQMSKRQADDGSTWTYRDELAAVVKFSQPQFYPHFVSIFGWFENETSIFIAMEYLPSGDLERFRGSSGPFSELDTSYIVKQLIKGVRHMHENGFTHRDLKPANILIASTAPIWQVKIADFGISKQAVQGATRQYTANMFGTMGYAAPEALGYFDEDDATITYTISVDIWAVGTIALALLLGRDVFPRQGDLSRYVNQQRALDFTREEGGELSDSCRDFVTRMLAPHPVTRPTAIAALAHPWLKQAVPPPPPLDNDAEVHSSQHTSEGDSVSPPTAHRIKEESPLRQYTRYSPYARKQTTPPDTKPTIKLETKDTAKLELYPTRDSASIERINNFLSLDNALLTPKLRTVLSPENRYFVLRSDNATDIETSAAHDVWTSSPRVNKILDKAYALSGGHVVMLFSVVLSRKFCGIARMTSPLDWDNTDPHWVEDVWQGRFTMEWLSLVELPFDGVKHVPVKESTPGFRAISCYDGTQISRGSAWELFRAYSAEERRQQL